MACQIDHAGEIPAAISKLEDSQAGFWRHKCSGCAYLMGRNDAAATEDRLRKRVKDLEAELVTLKADVP
jgi:hypothetical protein